MIFSIIFPFFLVGGGQKGWMGGVGLVLGWCSWVGVFILVVLVGGPGAQRCKWPDPGRSCFSRGTTKKKSLSHV